MQVALFVKPINEMINKNIFYMCLFRGGGVILLREFDKFDISMDVFEPPSPLFFSFAHVNVNREEGEWV